jgi:hypothetical protein
MNAKRVGIFVGGVQKCGTTSLHSYLSEHPRLMAPRKKETHFFDNERINWDQPDYERDFHLRFYPDWQADALAYDATPITIFWPPSIARIIDYNPAAKFIFLFRDPVERAFSHWCMEFARQAETLPFAAAIREGRQRLDGMAKLDPDWRVYSYVERGFYAEQLERVFERVPKEQVLALSSTELASAPAAALAKISAFLSIGAFPDSGARRVFVGGPTEREVTQGDVDYLSDIFAADAQRFSEMTALDTSEWLVCTRTRRP